TQGGLGIGLTLARRLVAMHGGSIDVSSEGSGKGSEFRVRLPLAASPETVAPEAPPEDGDRSAAIIRRGLPDRILVADDVEDSADSLALVLRTYGAEVRIAHDGEQALELAASFRPRAVLLDIGMPRLNGYEVAARIRAESWGRDMLLIALTG